MSPLANQYTRGRSPGKLRMTGRKFCLVHKGQIPSRAEDDIPRVLYKLPGSRRACFACAAALRAGVFDFKLLATLADEI